MNKLANKFNICQAFLGAKIHDAKDPGADLSAMLYQVVGATFELMDTYADIWKKVEETDQVPTFGFHYTVGLEPIAVNIEQMIRKFQLGVKELISIWSVFMPKEIVDFLRKALQMKRKGFYIPDSIWSEIIYSFAAATHTQVINKEHLLKSLTPLYIGRIASFVLEAWNSDAAEVEEKIEELCTVFEKKKPFLLENWENRRG